MDRPDLLDALVPVVDALERLGVAYLIGGSVASSALGIARATLDVDLVADLAPEHAQPLVQLLQASCYIDEEMILDAVLRRACFNIIHLETMLKVDVFVLKARPYDRQAFQRRRADTLDPGPHARQFFLASPEDTILNKLEWYRMEDKVSDRQWGDVVGVIRVQADALDREYLVHWAGVLGLGDLLQRALAEGGLDDDRDG